MSLINDVLRDLDQRGAGPASAIPVSGGGSSRPARRRLWPWWLVSAAVVGLLLHLAWRDFGEEAASLDRPAMAAAPIAEPDRELAAVPAARVPRLAETPTGPPERRPAGPAPADEPLPLPVAQDPPVAQAGEHRPALQPLSLAATENQVDTEPETPAPARLATAPAAGDEADEAALDSAEPLIRIERAPGASEQDAQPLLAARRALARGQDDLGRQHLESHLALVPGDHEARILLAQVHEQAGRTATAASVLEAGLDHPDPAPIAAALARQLLERDQSERARDLLLAHAHGAETNADYQLLLGAALRQNEQHEQALALYKSLAETHPHRGRVWIGLGSTLETLNQPQAARSAYQRALQADDPRAIAFARSRLFALPPDTDSAR